MSRLFIAVQYTLFLCGMRREKNSSATPSIVNWTTISLGIVHVQQLSTQ